MSFLNHASREPEQFAVSDHTTHGFGLSSKEVFQHDDAFFLGQAFAEAAPIAPTPEFLSDDDSFLPIPSEQRNAVKERVCISFTDVVEHRQSVGEADCTVVRISCSTGVSKSEIDVLLRIVGYRTAREGWECLCGHE